MKAQDLTMSAAEVGAIIGVTDRRVRQLAEEGVFPKAERGAYPLAGCVQAYVAMAESRSQPAELLQERIRLTKAQARRLEIENAMSEGTKQNLDAQDTITSVMATHLFMRIQPLSTWLYSELGEHGVGGRASTIIAGTVHNWLIGARAEVEAETRTAIERSRRRGFPMQHYEDLQHLIGGHVAAETEGRTNMTRKPLTPLQIELIERHHQRSSGRAAMTACALADTAPTGLAAEWAAQQNQKPAEPKAVSGLDATTIWAKWNASPATSLREQVERELHREPQPALNADEIYKRWNAPST